MTDPGFYRSVWRWHFYAGLLCIPFVCWLAITGSIYLWKPQVEGFLDRPYAHLLASGEARAKPSQEVAAALAAVPGAVLIHYQLPATPDGAAEITVGRKADQTRLWVHPANLKIVKQVKEDHRFMTVIFHLHGELLLGDKGSWLVELAASWAIIMIITGLYLWWPRGAQGMAGTLYPRLRTGGRIFWRDLHAVTAVWVSIFALLLLFSGLPWAKSWGGYLKSVRAVAGQAMIRQDWTVGRSNELAQRAALAAGSEAGRQVAREQALEDKSMASMPGMDHGGGGAMTGYDSIDRVVPALTSLSLPQPIVLTPPLEPAGRWMTLAGPKAPGDVNLELDGGSGQVVKRTGYFSGAPIDEAIGIGVAGHEGILFGLANQILALATAMGLLTASVSAVVMWWRRRPEGALGAPMPLGQPRYGAGLVALIVMLGVFLPLLGGSLVVVFLLERVVLRRVKPVRDWLGLAPTHG